jgi:phage terminase large subunit GpA-like protein
VQKTWVQGHVWGWGRGRQRWIVDRFILEGDPYHDAVWAELTNQLNRSYGTGQQLNIVRMAVDSGYATQEVYRWAKQQSSGRVLVVKGVDSGASLVTTPQQVEISQGGKKLKRGARVYTVNVSMCKSELYGLLAKDRPAAGEPFPPGWVHFASDLDEEFFRQLTAEQIVVRVVKGYRKHEWIKTRERNEDLDCCNYARAAASVFGLDRFSEHRWIEMEQQFGTWRPKSQSFVARKEQDTPAALRSQSPAQVQRVVVGARRPDWFGNRGRNWL